jgi:siroheme synthase
VLQRADVVVYDRLAPAALLDLAPRGAERVDAGKARGRAALSQEAINRVLVDRGRRGLEVVRLKGGDPFVFGRGGEEALALAEAGVRFEIVPGVSARRGRPRLRRHPGHPPRPGHQLRRRQRHPGRRRPGRPGPHRGRADTLVLLMAAERLREVCAQLIAAGRPPGQPAAVISSASTAAQQLLTGTLAELAATDAEVDPPATLVCGPSVALAGPLAWFTPSSGRPGRRRRAPRVRPARPADRRAPPHPTAPAAAARPPGRPDPGQPRSWRRTYWRMPPWR